MTWRVGLVDSCGHHPGAEAAAFFSEGSEVRVGEAGPDTSGHGSRIARLFAQAGDPALLLAQVFRDGRAASAAAVGAAIDWCVAREANLVHLSLGLQADRTILRDAVARALEAGVVVVAACAARGAPVYPAAYPGVLKATGDARCAAGEISVLDDGCFGAHPTLPGARMGQGGASAGAAWISRAVLELAPGQPVSTYREALAAGVRYRGSERRVS